jgi:hypothetical protein
VKTVKEGDKVEIEENRRTTTRNKKAKSRQRPTDLVAHDWDFGKWLSDRGTEGDELSEELGSFIELTIGRRWRRCLNRRVIL